MRLSAAVLVLALIATSFAACDRIVDLTPLDAARPPDAIDGDAPHALHDAGSDAVTQVEPPDAWMSDAAPAD